ncbi:dual specificity protein phosphatase family protein [Acinetobacter bouvetii]|uniref:Dual specificity phosphatase, catalytic domain n=1 Tax=Acinetobacter bouvetii TaxID=202951 RepID=A0A811GC19_9GAMM|nr:dual specificity protein phosphatase family protein [Acinetobacter bouvetii]CAB1217191.1 Dual specificity phosphatase, catalytic domain [Acinetobacter bouvetii]
MKKYIGIICISAACFVTGCMKSSALPKDERPSTWSQTIDKKNNFYQVSEWVYRSEQPHSDLLPELKKNHINIVINLRSSDSDPELFHDTSFQLIHIPINTWAMNRNDLLKVMHVLQDAQMRHKKVLIHCYHGSDRTGASIAMYRIIFQHWSIADALNEMKHGGYGFHPVWINIEQLFSPKNVRWIQQQLLNPS